MQRISYILLLGFILVIFTGCQKSEQTSMPFQSGNDKAKSNLIKAVSSESFDTKGMTKLDEFSSDLDLDNSEEKIGLYTHAEQDVNGKMMYNDGQDWLLAVWDGEKVYPLLSEYVQNGSVYFTVSKNGIEDASKEISHVNVIINTGAKFSVITYSFNKDKGGFVERNVYTSNDYNFVYSSIPNY